MYEYKFVKVKLSTLSASFLEKDYEAMVNDYAKQGWRLKQVLTPPTVGYGTIGYYEFVFERFVFEREI